MPEMHVVRLQPHHRMIILASDGLWEWMSNEDVLEAVRYCASDVKRSASLLVRKARKLWDDIGYATDDITVVVAQVGCGE